MIEEIFRLIPENTCPRPLQDESTRLQRSSIDSLQGQQHSNFRKLPLSSSIQSLIQANNETVGRIGTDSKRKFLSLYNFPGKCQAKFYKTHDNKLPIKEAQKETDLSSLNLFINNQVSVPKSGLENNEVLSKFLLNILSFLDFNIQSMYHALNKGQDLSVFKRMLTSASRATQDASAVATAVFSNTVLCRRDGVLSTNKFLSPKYATSLRSQPVNSEFLFNYQISKVVEMKTKDDQGKVMNNLVKLVSSNSSKPKQAAANRQTSTPSQKPSNQFGTSYIPTSDRNQKFQSNFGRGKTNTTTLSNSREVGNKPLFSTSKPRGFNRR